MKFIVSFNSGVTVTAKTPEEAADKVSDQDFDWADASMPHVTLVTIEGEGDEEPPDPEDFEE